jgi:hypothetical protein
MEVSMRRLSVNGDNLNLKNNFEESEEFQSIDEDSEEESKGQVEENSRGYQNELNESFSRIKINVKRNSECLK